jgi:hypothetical protein
VDIVQAVGRALRPAPNKQFGYVIVPILHDADATADDIFKSAAFKEVLTTLRALAANDDRIIEYFRGVSKGQQRKGGGSVQFDIDERLAKRINLADFAREIELKCWDRLAKLSWRPFEEAREFARNCGFRNAKEWRIFCKENQPEKGKLPSDIPVCPNQAYTDNGWTTWGDWLGTENIATYRRKYRPFQQAREFVRSLKLKKGIEWEAFCEGKMPHLERIPADIPAAPWATYADQGWIGMGDWLGTGNIACYLRKYRLFPQARSFSRSLNLKSGAEWRAFCKGEMPNLGKPPADIPANPNSTYADKGWAGMGDWLGTGTIAAHRRKYRSFHQARGFVRKLKFRSAKEWYSYCKGEMPLLDKFPADIPASPDRIYATKGWTDWGDWLGSGNKANVHTPSRPFEKARAYVRKLKLKNEGEWRAFCKCELPHLGIRPVYIPTNPNRVYADQGWAGMGDWLGTGRIATHLRKYRSFSQARAFARKLKLTRAKEWYAYCKSEMPHLKRLPPDIPANPREIYADKGWSGMGDWLGTDRTRVSKSPKRKS